MSEVKLSFFTSVFTWHRKVDCRDIFMGSDLFYPIVFTHL